MEVVQGILKLTLKEPFQDSKKLDQLEGTDVAYKARVSANEGKVSVEPSNSRFP